MREFIVCFYQDGEATFYKGDGSNGETIQFKKDTFQEFCVNRYNFRNDIMNCGIAKSCADLMIIDGLAYKWTALKFCK